jgi:hypothetical protein
MRRVIVALGVSVAAALVVTAASSATAQSYYWKESHGTVATYVYRFTITLPPCNNYSFETSNLSSGADTVMYLVDTASGAELAYNDDYLGQLRSRIDYNLSCVGSSQEVTAYVLAKSNASGGTGGKTFRFKFNGITEGTFRLGGYIVTSGTNATVSSDTMETVLVNNGATATMLLRFRWDGSHYRFDGADQTSGVGLASKLAGSGYFNERWVIGFRRHRTGSGSPLGSGNGALWTWYNTQCGGKDETFYGWTWGQLNATTQDFDLGRWHRTSLEPASCYVGERTYGVTMIDHPDGLAVYVRNEPYRDCPRGIFEVPFADGEATPPQPLVDYNDVAHIDLNLCKSVHWYDGDCKCQDFGCQTSQPPTPGPVHDCNDHVEP